jgi:hypothetical protein
MYKQKYASLLNIAEDHLSAKHAANSTNNLNSSAFYQLNGSLQSGAFLSSAYISFSLQREQELMEHML